MAETPRPSFFSLFSPSCFSSLSASLFSSSSPPSKACHVFVYYNPRDLGFFPRHRPPRSTRIDRARRPVKQAEVKTSLWFRSWTGRAKWLNGSCLMLVSYSTVHLSRLNPFHLKSLYSSCFPSSCKMPRGYIASSFPSNRTILAVGRKHKSKSKSNSTVSCGFLSHINHHAARLFLRPTFVLLLDPRPYGSTLNNGQHG